MNLYTQLMKRFLLENPDFMTEDLLFIEEAFNTWIDETLGIRLELGSEDNAILEKFPAGCLNNGRFSCSEIFDIPSSINQIKNCTFIRDGHLSVNLPSSISISETHFEAEKVFISGCCNLIRCTIKGDKWVTCRSSSFVSSKIRSKTISFEDGVMANSMNVEADLLQLTFSNIGHSEIQSETVDLRYSRIENSLFTNKGNITMMLVYSHLQNNEGDLAIERSINSSIKLRDGQEVVITSQNQNLLIQGAGIVRVLGHNNHLIIGSEIVEIIDDSNSRNNKFTHMFGG